MVISTLRYKSLCLGLLGQLKKMHIQLPIIYLVKVGTSIHFVKLVQRLVVNTCHFLSRTISSPSPLFWRTRRWRWCGPRTYSKCQRWPKNKQSNRQAVKKCQKSDEQTQNGKGGKKTKRQTHGSWADHRAPKPFKCTLCLYSGQKIPQNFHASQKRVSVTFQNRNIIVIFVHSSSIFWELLIGN